jgi:adenosylcobinamide-GDP ribazoletransferase
MLPWFPVVGALIGLVAAVAYVTASLVLPSLLAAALTIAATILLTGALHEDGLADAADAWGGARTREEALRILRDPTHGTYGVLALVVGVVVRVAALSAIAPAMAVGVLPAVHATSRGVLVGLIWTTRPARDDGLASALSLGAVRAFVGLAATLALGIGLLGAWFVPAAVLAVAAGWLVRWLAVRRIGGMTGDLRRHDAAIVARAARRDRVECCRAAERLAGRAAE